MSHATRTQSLVSRLAEQGGCVAGCPPLFLSKELNSPWLVFTHGNPEHRFEVDLYTLRVEHPDADWEDRVVDWLRRLHAYEGGNARRRDEW